MNAARCDFRATVLAYIDADLDADLTPNLTSLLEIEGHSHGKGGGAFDRLPWASVRAGLVKAWGEVDFK
jgi:hypothetical protein